MTRDALKLTAHYSERDRVRGGFLADRLVDTFAATGIHASATFRGVEGFGLKHSLQTSELLSLSEDLPMVTVAVDTRARIEPILDDVTEIMRGGIITLERAQLPATPTDHGDASKLTIYIGRRQRLDGRPAYEAIVAMLREHDVDGATVLAAIDGTVNGTRHRARFFATNTDVPVMIVSVGDHERITAALQELATSLAEPVITLERVTVCKRAGREVTRPTVLPDSSDGLRRWQRLSVYLDESAQHQGDPLHSTLIRRLRQQGAAGATSLRGFWGYHAETVPHGERFWALQRHVPLVVTVIDRSDHIQRWYDVIDELTTDTGVVTVETIPALLARHADRTRGGLRLASG